MEKALTDLEKGGGGRVEHYLSKTGPSLYTKTIRGTDGESTASTCEKVGSDRGEFREKMPIKISAGYNSWQKIGLVYIPGTSHLTVSLSVCTFRLGWRKVQVYALATPFFWSILGPSLCII